MPASTQEQERLNVGEVIRACREERGLSARQLALQSGLSESYVGKLEAGTIESVSLRAFSMIAKTLKLKPGEVYTIVCLEGME